MKNEANKSLEINSNISADDLEIKNINAFKNTNKALDKQSISHNTKSQIDIKSRNLIEKTENNFPLTRKSINNLENKTSIKTSNQNLKGNFYLYK